MTTSAYLALVEPVLTISELLASNVRTTLKIGSELIPYAPRADQLLSTMHMIEAFAEKNPANDNEPQEEAAPTEQQPATALDKNAALVEFMKALKNAPGAPRFASAMANDWLNNASRPGASFRGQQIVKQVALVWPKIFKLISRQAAAMLTPTVGVGRTQLKSMHNEIPVPQSVLLPTRQAKKKWDADHAQKIA